MKSIVSEVASTGDRCVTVNIGHGEVEIDFYVIDVRSTEDAEYAEYKQGFTLIPKKTQFKPFAPKPRLCCQLDPSCWCHVTDRPRIRTIDDAVIVCKTENHVFIVLAKDLSIVRIDGREPFRERNVDIAHFMFTVAMM